MSDQSSQDRIDSALVAILPDELRTKAGFRDWYFPFLYEVQVAAVELHEYVAKWLDQEKQQIASQEGRKRDLWFLFPDDAGGLTKSLDSLLTKLARDLLDEFSVFLRTSMQNDEPGMRELARLLKASRQASPGTRQLVSGSAGLAKYILFHDLRTGFDDLEPIELLPFSEVACRELAEELLYGAGVAPTPAAIARLAELGGPVPYFIHLLTDAVLVDHRLGPLSPEQVDVAYRERVLGPWANASFRAFRLGSQPYPHGLRRVATDLLRMIAREADGAPLPALNQRFAREASDEVAFESLLACLQEDFDLVEGHDRMRMRCRPLRDRWALEEGWLTEGA